MMPRVQRTIICMMWACIFVLPVFSAARADFKSVDFGGETWHTLKGRHFVIYYHPHTDQSQIRPVLRAAEDYYQKICDIVGFTRYSDFWTWDQRAKIFIFPNQASFLERTGAPAWSMGYADRDSYLFKSRAIVTYEQEKSLFDELLPHEISHLILHDFIPAANLPVWVDEGIAQLQEKNKYAAADGYMKALVRQGQYVRLNFLNQWNIRQETDAAKVQIFYAQSLSVIRFLREQYGKENFRRFCRNLRDEKPIEEALRFAYPKKIGSLKELEQLWVEFIINQ